MQSAQQVVRAWATAQLAGWAGPCLLGLSGPQGAGKSTLTAALAAAGELVVVGIDDVYLPRAERQRLAAEVSPLFAVRGPPGTHDLALLHETLDGLLAGRPTPLPRFDKRTDDRCPTADWPVQEGPARLIVVEGWCIGATLPPDFLDPAPLNAIEATDHDLRWRRGQAEALAGPYAALWDRMDAFAHLIAPDFATVLHWRTGQEAGTQGVALPDLAPERRAWVATFIQHYQRLTEAMAAGHRRPGLVLRLDVARSVVQITPPP
jgi:D-glycerate 3-kinase